MNDIDVLGQSQEDDQEGIGLSANDGLSVHQLDVPTRSDSLFSLYVPGDESSEPSSPSQSSSSSSSENQSLICPVFESSALERHQKQQPQSVISLRKKSIHRSRAAVLQRFQERSRRGRNGEPSIKTASVVSIAALKAALSQSPTSSYLDNGERDVYSSALRQHLQQQPQSKTVFVSDYI